MLSTAHIFYLPVLILVGVFVGYYVGRYHHDVDQAEKRKKGRRRNPRPQSDKA